MGCFNIGGFYTNQVISYGMDMVGFLCCEFDIEKVIWKKETETLHYSIPLSMPIFGKYDDYGRMEKIENSKVVDALEKYFGYDIDNIMSDVCEFAVDHYLDRGYGGRYRQITKGRKENPKYNFMKEEFDRYAPIYEKIRDSIPLLEGDTLKNFNLFFAFDHKALWEAFIIRDSEDSLSEDYGDAFWLFKTPIGIYGYYDTFDYGDKLKKLYLSINKEKTMLNDWSWFVANISNAGEFCFCPAKNYSQSYMTEQHLKLNELLVKAYSKEAENEY